MTIVDAPVALSRMRKAIVRTVTASAAVPQYTLAVDIDSAAISAARDRARTQHPDVSISDVINEAVIHSLVAHPTMNSFFTEEGIVAHSSVNLAFIVEVSDGMITPTIRDAQTLSLPQLAAERRRLTASALTGTLTPEEALSGTFTISNLGPLGVHRFSAMVLPPQAAILAVGAPTPTGTTSLTLTCDHRVIDGAPAARFLADVTRRLTEEEPA